MRHEHVEELRHKTVGAAVYQIRFGVLVENVDDDATRLSSLLSSLSSNPTPDPFVVSSNLNGETSLDRQQFSFQARKKLGSGNLTFTSSRQDWDLDPAATDLDLSPLSLASSRVLQSEDLWTHELRFESAPAANKSVWPEQSRFVQRPKFGIVSGPTFGMPSCPAQSWPRLSGDLVNLRRLYPSRISLIVVGLIV